MRKITTIDGSPVPELPVERNEIDGETWVHIQLVDDFDNLVSSVGPIRLGLDGEICILRKSSVRYAKHSGEMTYEGTNESDAWEK